jgi:orotidine-5'-phosphate decarboxylase
MSSAVIPTRSLNKAKEKIIVALDVDSAEKARELITELSDVVGAFKIGLQLFTAAGPEFVKEVCGRGIRVFLDLKFHDIPNTVAKAGIQAARLGVWMFNVHASGGSEMMQRTLGEVSEISVRESIERPRVIAVTVLTSTSGNGLNECGVQGDLQDQVVRLARLTVASGLDGVVASPIETRMIRESVERRDFLIVTPGVRPDSATLDDQKRVTTPGTAASNGSDFLVVGRPITDSSDPRTAAAAIVAEVNSALKAVQ